MRTALVVLLMATAAVLLMWRLRPMSSAAAAERLSACGGQIDVTLQGDGQGVSKEALLRWIKRATSAVCTYYGKFPVAHLELNVHLRGGAGVHHGVTYPSNGGGLIDISVGPGTREAKLDNDWMLTHEMIHLAFPSVAEKHHWIEEGLSTYVEPIARVQAGQLTDEKMWSEVVRDMPQGEPQPGDKGLDHTPTWGRTYWGGAMFALMADVRIRQATQNRIGLQDALRGILNAGGNINEDWEMERAFASGDKATGTTVLSDLYREMRDKPMPVDLAALWQKLGILRKPDGSVELANDAPLAPIRQAITAVPKR